MKSTPKIFARIALVLRILIWLQVLLFVIFPIISFFTLNEFQTLFSGNKLQLDTLGYYKRSLILANRRNNSELSSMSFLIYSPKFKKITDSLILKNKQLRFYQSGELIYSKSVDSLNKSNPNWLVELQLKLELDRLQASIKNADSLIKLGEATYAYFDSTGGASMTLKGSGYKFETKRIVKFKGNINFIPVGDSIYDEKRSKMDKDFGGYQSSKLELSNYAILERVNDRFEIEIKGSKKGTFEEKIIYYTSSFIVIYYSFIFFGITFFLHRFFVRLSYGEIFSNRQGNVFYLISFIFLFHCLTCVFYTVYDNYLISKLLALKNATTFKIVSVEDLIKPASYLIVSLFCLALAQVFKYGMKIEKDNERTI